MESAEIMVPIAEYADRRRRVLQALEGAAGLVLAGHETPVPSLGRWKTDRMFWYLTGLDHESGAAVLFDPSAEDEAKRITLFVRPRDPEIERWDGPREPIDSALKAKTGFPAIARTTAMPSRLSEAARRTKQLACLHQFANHNGPLSPDLELFRKVSERIPGVSIQDRTQLLPSMRAVKSATELGLIREAISATVAGYDRALSMIRPGIREEEIAQAMTASFREHGGEPAFDPIVGAGANGAVLHYIERNAVITAGDLVVIDYAASYGGYCSDVTRTLPAAGSFTREQRLLYEVVLEANLAAIDAARPGALISDVHRAAEDVIARAGYGDFFIHGIGHQLGAEVHDATPDGPLVSGMVMTIEPGIYLYDRCIGVRVEDDVLLTESGAVTLTVKIPKTVDAIEAAMAGR